MRCIIMAKAVSTPRSNGPFDAFSTAALRPPERWHLAAVPYRTKPETLFGIDRGKLEILGDINKPPDVVWEAETGRTQEENFRSFLIPMPCHGSGWAMKYYLRQCPWARERAALAMRFAMAQRWTSLGPS